MTRGISMKFSEKVWLMIILKVTKEHGFALSLENTFLERPQGGCAPVFLGLNRSSKCALS